MAPPPSNDRGPTDSPTGGEGVKSAERTVRILEILADSTEPMTLSDLHRATGYPRSSMHGLLRTLLALEWIEADPSGGFGIGHQALLCGTSYLDRDPALPHATVQLEAMRGELGWTTHYARRHGSRVIYLATRDSPESSRRFSRVGRQLPATVTALGRAMLAELTPAEVAKELPDPLPAPTRYSVTDPAVLATELDRVRATGHAVEHEQGTLGIACVAAPVRYRIPATDAISCSMPTEAATVTELERVTAVVRKHAEQLALTLRREGIR